MKSMIYITPITRFRSAVLLLGTAIGLAGCAEAPITKTNCWATAGSTLTTSTKGASPDAGLVSRGNTWPVDAIPCR